MASDPRSTLRVHITDRGTGILVKDEAPAELPKSLPWREFIAMAIICALTGFGVYVALAFRTGGL